MRLLLALILAVMLAGCEKQKSPPPPPAAQDSPQWETFVDHYLDRYFTINPSFAVAQGKHEYDGQLPDWSDKGLADRIAFLRKWKEVTEKIDGHLLSKNQQFERDYLVSMMSAELFWLTDADAPHKNIAWYFSNGLDPAVYVTRPYADLATRMRAFTAFARAIPSRLVQIKSNLNAPMPVTHVDYAVSSFKGMTEFYLKNAKEAFAGAGDSTQREDLEQTITAASAAMLDMAVWAENKRATATQDFALGKDKFERMLAETEDVTTPIDELYKLAMVDLMHNQAALKAVCATWAPKTTPGGCIMQMNASKPKPDSVGEARGQLPLLRRFLVDNDVVSIPDTDTANVAEAPPYARQSAGFVNVPGAFDKDIPATYYISPPDPNWPREEQMPYIPGKANLLFASMHSVWPGHFLAYLHRKEVKSPVGKVFSSNAFLEGWAHYSEELMWESGFKADDPETRVGQLANALQRNCRFLSAIAMHTQGMTVEQSRLMFREDCFLDEASARQQSTRATWDAAYLSQTLGKLMIRKLRNDWSADKGGKKAWKAFHDTFLNYGAPPIPLVRAAMIGGEPKAVF